MKIAVNNLSKKIKSNIIIDNVSVDFETGHIYGLYGRNGSGKSVFLKLICSLYEPTSGEILINGVNYSSTNNFPPDIRALIEKPHFFPDLSGYDNLRLLAKIQNKITDKEILNSLDIVNLIDEKDKLYSKYSLGMKQKLGIAQVLMEDPKIMIFDEPFNGIEDESANKIRNMLKKMRKDKIIIIASHIKDDINDLADIRYKFENGKISK